MKKTLVLAFLLITSAHANIIKLVGVTNCPYTCSENEANPGFVVDLIAEVFKKEGFEISYTSFKDYEEALETIKTGNSDIMIDVDPSKNPELIFMKKPLAYKHNVIVVPKYLKWKYTSPQSLNELKLAVIEEEIYTNEISEYIAKNKTNPSRINVKSGHLARKHNLKDLRFEKVDALIDDRIALRYFYYKKHKPFAFKVAYTASSKAIHIAFAAKNYRSNKYKEILYRGLKKLTHTQKIKTIFSKYGLSEAYIRALKKAH